MNIPDAPWIEETERTGYCRSGWWNNPPEEETDDEDMEDNTIFGYTHLIGNPDARRKLRKITDWICFGLSMVEALLAGLGFIALLAIINW